MSTNKIVENYKEDRQRVLSFLDLTKAVFPWADFSSWYKSGFWPDEYIPHSMVIEGKIVSNVSITKMDILLNGERKKGIQIGTVGTLPEFRGRGMSGSLMKYTLDKYIDHTDLFFLFANETVLDFYPKYGFARKNETLYYSRTIGSDTGQNLKKLDWKKGDDLDLIQKLLTNRLPVTSMFGAENSLAITMWHIINVYPGDIYYDRDQNMILIFYTKGETIHLIDLIYTQNPDMDKVFSLLSGFGKPSTICCHFPPDRTGFNFDHSEEDKDTMFFTKGEFHPPEGFKFPVTSQT